MSLAVDCGKLPPASTSGPLKSDAVPLLPWRTVPSATEFAAVEKSPASPLSSVTKFPT